MFFYINVFSINDEFRKHNGAIINDPKAINIMSLTQPFIDIKAEKIMKK